MSILQELNDAISKGTPESRLTALWHATDMLIMGRYTESEIWIFGEVIGSLSEEIELAARSQLAKRLARSDKAPISVIHKLAFDDSIDVAGPILRYSERLDNQALVRNARCKSQQHLFAISRRQSIDEPVTDVLVTRGDQTVVNSVAVNIGAPARGRECSRRCSRIAARDVWPCVKKLLCRQKNHRCAAPSRQSRRSRDS